ncbi:LamG-like jellyroll fold domain-containing protein [Undibacterium sp. Ji50W]|uniref:LamG-like jellyroll fold domain-containing protein n=1 Tax=Undibacterium sp. Ji50W TaxID=3413041 RepID=UPI003BF3FE17
MDTLTATITRRSFLYGLGALALTACGGSAKQQLESAQIPSTNKTGATTNGFAHPGLLHTQTDFERMAVKFNTEPWKSSWDLLIANSHASLNYTPAAVPVVYRGADGSNPENYSRLFNDIAAAYACALRWKISGNSAYADKAVQIMNAWSSTLTGISGTSDMNLAAGIYGYEFANAGEIMRSYSGWAAADFARFQSMMRNIFYPMNHGFLEGHLNTEITHYWSNWDLCNMASVLAIGVLCDERALFDEAITYFKSGAGNGAVAQAIYYVHPGYLGQWQETGRDQGHNTLGIALMGSLCEMAWNQGVDLYGYDNNRFLMGAEYVAKANLIESGSNYYSVPYVTYTNVDKVNQTVLSTAGQGTVRPCWALVYNHYVNRMGLAAPYTQKFTQLVQPEGGGGNYGPNSGGFDQLGYGTLTCTLDTTASRAGPTGLSAYVSAGQVILSWWGMTNASSYTVKRATNAAGPYTTLASGITDLLSYTDTGLADGEWYYVVTASTSKGESAASNVVSAITGLRLHTRLSFDESSGAVAADSSGNGHTGTLTGGTGWVAGKISNAISLDGSSGYVSLPPDIMTDVGDFSICTWVYWNAARTWDRVFDFGSGTGHYMMLTARGANGLARFAMTVNGRDGELFVDSPAALPTGAWTHIAVTLSGRTCKLYVNGTVVGSNTDMFQAPFRLQSTSQNWIGRSQNTAQPYFNGKIDDFRIYRGALNVAQVLALMNNQTI